MQKGKFGFSLWLYPFVSMWLMLFDQTLANVVILGFVIVAEQDEWAIKQCAHVLMFSIYWGMYQFIVGMIEGWLSSIPLVGGLAATPINIIDTVVWVILVIMCFILGLSRLKRGEDIGLPGRKIINRAYGIAQQQWDNGQQRRQQEHYQQGQGYQPPYQQQDYRQQPPYQQPIQQQHYQQPYPTQGQGYQPPQPPPPSQGYYAEPQQQQPAPSPTVPQQPVPPAPPPASPNTNRPIPPPPPPPRR